MEGLKNEMALANAQELINVCNRLERLATNQLGHFRKLMKSALQSASQNPLHRLEAQKRHASRAAWTGIWRLVSAFVQMRSLS